MDCLLKGNAPKKKQVANESRKKRAADAQKQNYGCPKDFVKLSEYMCVYLRKDDNGNPSKNSFDDSQSYCRHKEPGGSLLYFLNHNDAVNVWEWLGKDNDLEHVLFFLISIVYNRQQNK